jgi:hypothetical protein
VRPVAAPSTISYAIPAWNGYVPVSLSGYPMWTATRTREASSHRDAVCWRCCDRPEDVLRFVYDLKVPPTSNQAERDLRPAKTQQKISGRLTSEAVTRARYRIRGYLSTAAKHGQDMMDALRQAILGRPWMPPDPTPT